MKYILDTHSLIWSVQDTKKLSKKAKSILIDTSITPLQTYHYAVCRIGLLCRILGT